MNVPSISTSSEAQENLENQTQSQSSLNEDVRELARAQLDNAAHVNQSTGQLDFTHVLKKKDSEFEVEVDAKKSPENAEQQDFRNVLKSKQATKVGSEQGVQQIDFRNMLKKKVNTKTQNEYSTRSQNAKQIDFRDNLKKKAEVTKSEV